MTARGRRGRIPGHQRCVRRCTVGSTPQEADMIQSADPQLDSSTTPGHSQPTFTRREALAIAAASLLPQHTGPFGGVQEDHRRGRRHRRVELRVGTGAPRTRRHRHRSIGTDRRPCLDVSRWARRRALCGCRRRAFYAAGIRAVLGLRPRVQSAVRLLPAPRAPPAVDRRSNVHARDAGRSQGARHTWPEPPRGRTI